MAKYYYRKYLLPEIPVVEGYSYAVILKNTNSNFMRLAFSKSPWYFKNDGVYADGTNKRYKLLFDATQTDAIEFSGEWIEDGESTSGLTISNLITYAWSNEDIFDGSPTSSTIWMKGHEPSLVPYIGVYNSVEDLFDEQRQDLVCLVNNSSYDDNSYTITSVPSWIKFNNIAVTSIQVNGNSWIGFNGSTEHIKFNRRDTKMYFLWTEEGLLYNHYRFYRIRWRGYSQYNSTSLSNLQVWEAIFFDTGDICIHAINIPTSNYDGTNNIIASQTYAYAKLTTENRFVTFYTQDENNTTFVVKQECIELEAPYDKRFLIRASNKIYTISAETLVEVEGVEINADLFRNHGVNEIPNGALLTTLVDPEILYWIDTNEYEIKKVQVTEKATPFPQTLVSVDYDMTHPSILGIEKVTVDATNGALFAVSFDSGESWKIWTGQTWGELSEENTGMSAETITSITSEQWNEVATTGKFRFRVILSTIEDKFKSLIVDYVNV